MTGCAVVRIYTRVIKRHVGGKRRGTAVAVRTLRRGIDMIRIFTCTYNAIMTGNTVGRRNHNVIKGAGRESAWSMTVITIIGGLIDWHMRGCQTTYRVIYR